MGKVKVMMEKVIERFAKGGGNFEWWVAGNWPRNGLSKSKLWFRTFSPQIQARKVLFEGSLGGRIINYVSFSPIVTENGRICDGKWKITKFSISLFRKSPMVYFEGPLDSSIINCIVFRPSQLKTGGVKCKKSKRVFFALPALISLIKSYIF